MQPFLACRIFRIIRTLYIRWIKLILVVGLLTMIILGFSQIMMKA